MKQYVQKRTKTDSKANMDNYHQCLSAPDHEIVIIINSVTDTVAVRHILVYLIIVMLREEHLL